MRRKKEEEKRRLQRGQKKKNPSRKNPAEEPQEISHQVTVTVRSLEVVMRKTR